jgi:hypothetical protein
MQAKLLSPVISGIIGGILIPVVYRFLLWFADMIYPPNLIVAGNDGIQFSIFFIWVLIIIPIILACTGTLSLIIGSRYQLNRLDHIILPEISGIVAIALAVVLFLSITPAAISLDWVAVWIRSINFETLIGSAIMIVYMLIWAQCSVFGLILYRVIFRRELPDA